MADIRDDVSALAHRYMENGQSLKVAVEMICQAMIDLVPDDHPHRLIILEGAYAALAKVLGRDASKFLE